jgi:hypothetical protein
MRIEGPVGIEPRPRSVPLPLGDRRHLRQRPRVHVLQLPPHQHSQMLMQSCTGAFPPQARALQTPLDSRKDTTGAQQIQSRGHWTELRQEPSAPPSSRGLHWSGARSVQAPALHRPLGHSQSAMQSWTLGFWPQYCWHARGSFLVRPKLNVEQQICPMGQSAALVPFGPDALAVPDSPSSPSLGVPPNFSYPPPREDGPVDLTRSNARPERHFADSFATARLAIARVLALWLPRCPVCHRHCVCTPPGFPMRPSTEKQWPQSDESRHSPVSAQRRSSSGVTTTPSFGCLVCSSNARRTCSASFGWGANAAALRFTCFALRGAMTKA